VGSTLGLATTLFGSAHLPLGVLVGRTRPSKQSADSVLEEEGAAEAAEGLLPDKDREGFMEEVTKRRDRKARQKAAAETSAASSPKADEGLELGLAALPGGSDANSNVAIVVAPRAPDARRPLLAPVAGAYSRADVEAWLPQVTGCKALRERKWHSRWRFYYPASSAPFSVSRSFTDAASERTVLLFLVHWAWLRHQASGGDPPPFELGNMFAEGVP